MTRTLLQITPGRDAVALPLDRDVTHLGRGLSSQLRLDDATVSHRHAMVVRQGDTALLLDDRSINGTTLNGERIDRAVLRHGDVIDLGRTRLTYLEVSTAAEDREEAAQPVPLLCCG